MSTSAFRAMMVPLDGSPLAEMAIPVAAALARRAGAKLHLVSVQPPAHWYSTTTAATAKAIEDQARERLEGYLAAQAEVVCSCHGLEANAAVLAGSAAQMLADYARTHAIGLIIMTTHGRSGLGRLWLGSVADRLLRRTSVPTLLLRSKEQPQHMDFRDVLVALDGSPAGDAVLEPALALASLYHEPRCALVHVIEPPLGLSDDATVYPDRVYATFIEQEHGSVTAHMKRLTEQLMARGVAATAHVSVTVGVGAHIVDLAGKLNSSVIAVGSHGRPGVERLLLGSVADKVVRGAAIPVLVVPIVVHHRG